MVFLVKLLVVFSGFVVVFGKVFSFSRVFDCFCSHFSFGQLSCHIKGIMKPGPVHHPKPVALHIERLGERNGSGVNRDGCVGVCFSWPSMKWLVFKSVS